MATASTTANQALCSTYEKENYQRLSRLIMGAGTVLFRAVFDYFYPPSSLGSKLREPGNRQELDKVLLKPQRALVYPASGLCGESKDFDISLLSTLLKILCRTQLPPLSSGWDRSPATDNESLTADIVRVKLYRNDIIHKFHRGELSDAKFCSLWDKIKTTLLRIASFISAETSHEWEDKIEKFRHDPLTPEAERNAEELQKWDQKDMDTKEYLVAGFARMERQIQSSSEEGRERFDRLEREIQDQRNEIEQLRELVTNRDSSSLAEGEASVRIIIDHDVGSITSRAQVEQLIQRTASEIRRHFDPSINEENQFVQRLEDINQVLIINVSRGSLVLTVKCTSLEILERLWQDYSSGHLGKVAQEFLVTDKVLEDLGLVELKLRITVLEEDYRECRRHFTKCAGSDFPNKREGEQKKDDREDECISSQDLTGNNANQVPVANVNRGRLVLTVKCASLEILERFWQDYSSGELSKVAQESLVTDKGLEYLGPLEPKRLKITVPEEDYRECRRHFTKCAGSDNSDEREGEQKEDEKEEEYIPPQHATGICRKLSPLPRTVTHFVNRETECQKIKDCLSPLHNCRCLLIHGATGMGKTTVAMKVANDILNSDRQTVVIYVNCRDIKLFHDFAAKVLQQIYHYPVDDPVEKFKLLLTS